MAMTAEEKKERNRINNINLRLRKGDEINANRKAKKDALKAITRIPAVITTPTLKKATKLPPQSTAPKQENTKQNYISFIKVFYKNYTGDDLQEEADIIKKINEEPFKAIAVSRQFKPIITAFIKDIIKTPHQVKNLYAILRGIRGFTDIEKILEPYLKEYQRQYQEQRSIISADPADIDRIDFDNLEEYKANIAKLDNITDKVIYSYSIIVKRRPSDLRLTKIAKSKEDIKNINSNWLYQGKLYINTTKNKKSIIIDLPAELNFWKDITGEYLLGRLIPQATLSQQIQRIFLKIYGKIYTANNIRHLYASAVNNKGATLQERQETAKKSGHSVMEQLAYAYKNTNQI